MAIGEKDTLELRITPKPWTVEEQVWEDGSTTVWIKAGQRPVAKFYTRHDAEYVILCLTGADDAVGVIQKLTAEKEKLEDRIEALEESLHNREDADDPA